MSLGDKIMDIIDQGIEASKDFAVKTGEKAVNIGERSVLLLETKQLEARARELVNKLGKEAYNAFTVLDQYSIDREMPEIAGILTELEKVRDMINFKEAELALKRDKGHIA